MDKLSPCPFFKIKYFLVKKKKFGQPRIKLINSGLSKNKYPDIINNKTIYGMIDYLTHNIIFYTTQN